MEKCMKCQKIKGEGGETYRSEGIDGLRAFCCIAIVAWHVLANGGFQIDGYIVDVIIPSWNDLVYLFMMISGFGICNGYYESIKNNEISLERFYKRRYSKILPFFALLIIANIIVEYSIESLAEGFIELTLVFGLLPNNQLEVIGVAWTLGVIFVFYMIFPFVVFLMWNEKRAWLAFFCSLIIQFLCKTYFMTEKFVGKSFSLKHSFLFCMPFFLIGCLLYLYKNNVVEFVRKHSQITLVACCITTVLYFLIQKEIKGSNINEFLLLALYSFWLIYAIGTTNKVICNKQIRFVSGISMEIYLSHMLCFRILEKFDIIQFLGNGIVSYICVVTIIVTMLIITIPIIQKTINKIIVTYVKES